MITKTQLNEFVSRHHLYHYDNYLKFSEKDSGGLYFIKDDGTRVSVRTCDCIFLFPGDDNISYCGFGPYLDNLNELEENFEKRYKEMKELKKKIRFDKIEKL